MSAPDERPLTELLDAFWQGSVPGRADQDGQDDRAGQAGRDDRPEGGAVTALDELGPSGVTSRGRPLDAALAAAYRRFTGTG
ncbi:hypothetical protein ACFVFS_36145 [Kitasatospora sp. NPDC057692]|uniref:hypothetical protein n=1 Tax=Kitasatospora sp. NPDC057692 TaxID=3346215 RepID=UPI00367659DD